ncbi:MAG: glycogen debranching protein GlgX [Polyangiales bacterium]
MKLLPGSSHPLGATWDGEGVNFALYSENASGVELCLFDEAGQETRLSLPHKTAFVWHGYVPGLKPGQRYGFRVHGPYEPERGLRFNPEVVLLDPYAKALEGKERWEHGCFAYELGHDDLHKTETPQLGVPRGVVIDPEFDWEGDEPPRIPLHRSVIYEAHVRGLSMRHPDVPEALRGTYAGIAHPAIVTYLRDLGVTAIELMPIHAFVDDKTLLDKGLRNYWGYNSIGFFAPDVRYRSSTVLGDEVREFKAMVKALHRAGIEVILDVVYNHTAEGNHLGPTFNLKGIDNTTYYRQVPDQPRFYFDYTGTGNTLNVRHPQVLAMIMDSLRYWAIEMHVDGFRFDLASALARSLHEVDQLSSFFTLIHQSPVLNHLKLIAEPWDVGEGGYQVGNFPVRWAEWNGRYRDAVRSLWRGDGGRAAEIGYRLTGSSDLYEASGRRPTASINLVTAHDGFTLNDLVSYNEKHNDANGEGNQDGNNHEHSWNCGVEGDTQDAEVLALRKRQRRNLLATLLLSQGTPMLVAGDEYGRTQGGNNNAYCQDNEVSWFDWEWNEEQRALMEFVKRVLRIRREHPSLHRSKFFQSRGIHGTDLQDLVWLRHDGQAMSVDDWQNPHTKSMAMFLAGRGIDEVDEAGRPLVDDNLLLLINASQQDIPFTVPKMSAVREPWQLLLDTNDDQAEERCLPGDSTTLVARSLKFFRAPSRVIRAGGSVHALNSTYRLQLNDKFTLADATEVVDYLSELGITDLYASPILQATPGSTHGYDVVDHTRINDELGGEPALDALSQKLKQRGLGLLVDWVPNHMGIAGANKLWDDVLENGPSSLYAEYFDIDWSPAREDLHDRVLLPTLGDQYGEVLERGELKVVWEEDCCFRLAYWERRLPLGPKTVLPLIEGMLNRSELSEEDPARIELESICSALKHLPERHETGARERRERSREKEVIRQRLQRVVEGSAVVKFALDAELLELNGTPGLPTSFDALDRLLRQQSYRLASWRVAFEEINYRRFFDVNDLAAVRMVEQQALFDHAHALIFRLIDERKINGLRLDHTDGLFDPVQYFENLQRRFPTVVPAGEDAPSPDDLARPLPLLVEKILEPGEQLPTTWPVDGTTGYEFANAALGLWVNARAERALSELYVRITGDRHTFQEHVYESKQLVLRYSFASELNMLGRSLERIASQNRKWRDFTRAGLTRALAETIAAFPVYRTYFRADNALGEQRSDADQQRVRSALARARRRVPSISPTLFAFLEDLLLLRTEPEDEDARKEHTFFALRFQQLTGPVTAKAVEDTAFYRYHRLVCLNEVGGMPGQFGTSVESFHRQNAERARAWPRSMISTSTHDTKRGEDTSARIAVLSELPELWARTVRRWLQFVEPIHAVLPALEGNGVVYLLFQCLVGAVPYGWDGQVEELAERLAAYLLKASREAKQETSWTNPNPAYDEAVQELPRRLLANPRFVQDLQTFVRVIEPHGACNSFAQTVLRLTAPGVPDTYQGSELWNQSLVDPDNRRPVDFAHRRQLLARVKETPVAELLRDYQSGALKLFLTQALLQQRKLHPDLFLRGDYEGLAAPDSAVAFTRSYGGARLIVAVPRLSYLLTRGEQAFPLRESWRDGKLRVPYAGRYRNVLTDAVLNARGSLRLSEVFSDLPVALLLRENEG